MNRRRIPPAVEPILAWWLPAVRCCLGDNLRSVMLCGSATLGDFCPRWSDVDVCVVLASPITHGEAQAIGGIHDEMRRRFIEGKEGGWESGQAIEGCYIPAELASDPSAQMPCYTAGGTTRKWAVGNPVGPFDRYILAHFGYSVAGEHVVFGPPATEALVGQTEQDLAPLRRWNDHSEQSALWVAGMLHWIAQSLVFWRDGDMMSKSAALRGEIERGSVFADAFRLALEVREAGSATAASHHSELRRHFGRVARPAAREIERQMRGRSNAQARETGRSRHGMKRLGQCDL